MERIHRVLNGTLAGQLQAGTVSIAMGREGLVISLREAGFFDSGSALPKPAALPTLRQIAASLAGTPYSLRVEGHTDNVPIHNADFDSNWELSTARATRIARLLLALKAVSPGLALGRRLRRIFWTRGQQQHRARTSAEPARRRGDPAADENQLDRCQRIACERSLAQDYGWRPSSRSASQRVSESALSKRRQSGFQACSSDGSGCADSRFNPQHFQQSPACAAGRRTLHRRRAATCPG